MPVNKSTEEWVIVRYFREKYKQFPKGKLMKSESPDFILKTNRKKQIGIELTRLDYLIDENTSRDELFRVFKSLIDRKEHKLSIYRKKILNEYWLIITIDDFEFDDLMAKISGYHSAAGISFDKVFLFDLFSAEILEVVNGG